MANYSQYAQGQWPSILVALAGLTESQVTNKHQPCPLCGGEDRYRFDDKDGQGTWFCNQCGGPTETGGGGNGMSMLMRRNNWGFAEGIRRLEAHLNIRPEPPIKNAEHVWRYNDDFYVCRFPGKRIRPLWFDGTEWKWAAPPALRPLYNLDSLSQRPDAPVLIVEGEKTADAAAKLFPSAVAITWPSGCKAINKADWSQLIGRNCTLWPDADAPGIQAMDKLSAKLEQLGAAQVRIVTPPPAVPEGWDLADAEWTIDEAGAYLKANKSKPLAIAAEPADQLVEIDREKQLSRQKQGTAKSVDMAKPVKAQAEKLVEQLPEGWTAKIKVTSEGPVKTAERKKIKTGCLVKLLKAYIGDNLRFNELSLYAEYNNKTVTSSELEHFYIQLSEHGYTIPKKDAADCLIYKAKQHSYHPVREYLNHIKTNNDVIPADISNLASKYLNATNPLHDTMLRKTLIGAVARVMDPGCKFDTCLVLAGATGIGKSTFFKTLASPAWFCDTAQDQEKDLKMLIHSTWIYELAELETKTGKKEAGEIKALLSGSTDKFRAPYAAAMEDHDRKSIFVATCNRRDFLRDETGSRRYWVIPVPNAMHEKIDVTGLLENRDAIWKAAVLAYFNGEKPFLNIQDELSSEQENKAYEPEDIWLAPMEHWLNKLRLERQFTTAEALVGAGLRQRDHLSSDDQRRAAVVLRELGCVQEKNPIRVQGKRARVWKVGTDGTDPSDGSVPAETNCTGTGPSVLAQITDKKVKTFEFLSTESTTATAVPAREKTHGENKKDLCICANTLEPVALQPITAGTDPHNELCQAPSSVPELSDLGSGYDAAADGDDPHWAPRP